MDIYSRINATMALYIVSDPKKQSARLRILIAKQGSAAAACLYGKQEGTDVAARQKTILAFCFLVCRLYA